MEQSSTYRRVRKTKKQLRLALMELLAEKSAKSISVRELAERADINRGTFYIHYRDVGDLLQRLEDEMADRLTALCKEHKPEDSTGEQFPFLRDLYRFILDNADLCRVLLGPNGDIAYTDRICCILRDYFLYDFLSQFRPGDRQRLNHFCSFIVSGNLNLALSWLRDGGQESPDEMARLAGSIIMGGRERPRCAKSVTGPESLQLLITTPLMQVMRLHEGCFFLFSGSMQLLPEALSLLTVRFPRPAAGPAGSLRPGRR